MKIIALLAALVVFSFGTIAAAATLQKLTPKRFLESCQNLATERELGTSMGDRRARRDFVIAWMQGRQQ
ncbi:MAG: hypothetical protein J0H38_05645 [Rhizobiales bacterium]|nr:hypothetical protein [Hyphomicrobiales bacterium]